MADVKRSKFAEQFADTVVNKIPKGQKPLDISRARSIAVRIGAIRETSASVNIIRRHRAKAEAFRELWGRSPRKEEYDALYQEAVDEAITIAADWYIGKFIKKVN